MIYQPRTIDTTLERMLTIAGAILIEGVRACGKTATGTRHSKSVVRLDVDDDARMLAAVSPNLVLDGATPRLIDEWQLEPQLWNHVRRTIDDRGGPGQFLLAGSSTPPDDITRHSGAGRILRVRMRPMSLYESQQSTGAVSLSALVDGGRVDGARSELNVSAIAERLTIGGWPALQRFGPDDAQTILRSYLDDVARADVQVVDDVIRRDPVRVTRLLRAYARHVATSASLATIAADTNDGAGASLRQETVAAYVTALERVLVIEEQPSWGPHLRSRDIVRKRAVRHFVDPSLAVAALGAGPERLLRDLNTFGLLFESMVVRDLRVYSQLIDGEVRRYRDSAGTEADAIIQLRDGRWAAIEVKLAATQTDAAAASLAALVSKIDVEKAGAPAARIVITAGEYAYTRPDGVHVVPIGCLGP